MQKNLMLEVLERAVSGTSKRVRFLSHIAVVLVSVSLFRGNNWKAIVAKMAFLAIGLLFVFLFERYKWWRTAAGGPRLNGRQLWRRFVIVAVVLLVIYIGLTLYLAVFSDNPNGLALLFPFYLLLLFLCALPLFWEFRDLRTIESEGSSI